MFLAAQAGLSFSVVLGSYAPANFLLERISGVDTLPRRPCNTFTVQIITSVVSSWFLSSVRTVGEEGLGLAAENAA